MVMDQPQIFATYFARRHINQSLHFDFGRKNSQHGRVMLFFINQ